MTKTVSSYPKFTVFTIEDEYLFEKIVEKYPPFSDLSFKTLMVWWTKEDYNFELSFLNNNLILNYQLPGNEGSSGLSLIGHTKVDETLEVIFSDKKIKELVHVPECTIQNIRSKKYKITEEDDYDEYILSTKDLTELTSPAHAKTRRKVKKFIREVGDRRVSLEKLNLADRTVSDQLFAKTLEWQEKYGMPNDVKGDEIIAIRKTLELSKKLNFLGLGLFIQEELHAFLIYQQTKNKEYFIVNHIKKAKEFDRIEDFLVHAFAKEAYSQGVPYINLEMDLGIEGLRIHKMGLRPIRFFKKYRITI